MNNYANAAKMKHLRRTVLELLCTNHDEQKSRFDGTALWSALVRGLGFDIGKNQLKTVLQDLKDRGYVTFDQQRDDDTGNIYMLRIELKSKGRDLLEGTITDPALEL